MPVSLDIVTLNQFSFCCFARIYAENQVAEFGKDDSEDERVTGVRHPAMITHQFKIRKPHPPPHNCTLFAVWLEMIETHIALIPIVQGIP